MRTVKQLLAWVLIIMLGTAIRALLPFANWNYFATFIPLAFVTSSPSAIIFIIIQNRIIAKTSLSAKKENYILLGIHLLLTYLTFLILTGFRLHSGPFTYYHLPIIYGISGIIVWSSYLFTINKQN